MELKREILRFCDPSTLEKTSRVSFAFLEMSSPTLYEHVEIVGFHNLMKLFCTRHPSLHQPQLEPYLSLQRIRSLSFLTRGIGHPSPQLSHDRVPSSISLRSLRVGIRCHTERFMRTPMVVCRVPTSAWAPIFSLFEPEEVYIHSLPRPQVPNILRRLDLGEAPSWPRLRVLDVWACSVQFPDIGDGFLSRLEERGGQEDRGGLSILVDPRVELESNRLTVKTNYNVVECHLLGADDDECLLDYTQIKQVVLRLQSSEGDQARTFDFMAYVRRRWIEEGADAETVGRRSSRLTVEVQIEDSDA